jgi:hypothetical protein
VITFDEDPAEFMTWRAGVIASLKPEGALESNLVQEIIIAGWKLARLHRIESKQLATEKAVLEKEIKTATDSDDKPAGHPGPEHLQSLVSLSHPEQETDESDEEYAANPARIFRRLGYEIEKLSRYRQTVERSLYRALSQLERLQARRNSAPVELPRVFEVDTDRHNRDD